MSFFIQQLINGLSIGSIYGLASVGYSLIYSILGFSNFAHGELTMVGAFAAFLSVATAHLPFPIALIFGAGASALTAVLMERLAYRPLRMKKAPSLYFFIAACGVSFMLANGFLVTMGATFRTFPPVFPVKTISIAGMSIGVIDLVTFLITAVAVLVLEYILAFTKTGKAIRASAYDGEMASMLGINMDVICFIIFFMAGCLAGLSGLFRGMKYTVYPTMGNIILKAWICAIFGGIGSVQGALVGALVLGILETFAAAYISSALKDILAFVILITILVVKPTGLFGKVTEEKA
ncbi:MAG TPA: branched-chain amino acid ABC transporter permease [Clostridia bacterium]|nr:branched-chain amino acid ABC transporter permease [Clostridia bacterium]